MNLECEIEKIVESTVDTQALLREYGLRAQRQLFEVEDFQQVLEQFSVQQVQSTNPTLNIVAGPPLSGKSFYVKQLREKFPEAFVLQFDEIMLCMKGYKNLFDERGSEVAFKAFELPARWLGYQLLIRAVKSDSSIIWEHSSALEQHVRLYKLINEKSEYQVQMTVINTPMEVINQRIDMKRDGGRYLPPPYISERIEKLKMLLPEYKKYIPVNQVRGVL